MHEYQIPKTAKTVKEIVIPYKNTKQHPNLQLLTHTTLGALTLRLPAPLTSDSECRQKYRQWFSYIHHIIPHAHFTSVYFKGRAVIEISLNFHYVLLRLEIRPIKLICIWAHTPQAKEDLLATCCLLFSH